MLSHIYAILIFILCMLFLFYLECVHLLLAHGAPVKIKNSQGWNPLAEAISYGDRQISMFHQCIIFNDSIVRYYLCISSGLTLV